MFCQQRKDMLTHTQQDASIWCMITYYATHLCNTFMHAHTPALTVPSTDRKNFFGCGENEKIVFLQWRKQACLYLIKGNIFLTGFWKSWKNAWWVPSLVMCVKLQVKHTQVHLSCSKHKFIAYNCIWHTPINVPLWWQIILIFKLTLQGSSNQCYQHPYTSRRGDHKDLKFRLNNFRPLPSERTASLYTWNSVVSIVVKARNQWRLEESLWNDSTHLE